MRTVGYKQDPLAQFVRKRYFVLKTSINNTKRDFR